MNSPQAVGLFAEEDLISEGFSKYNGFIWGGETWLLGVQCLATLIIIIWSTTSTFLLLFLIDLVCPIRCEDKIRNIVCNLESIIPSSKSTPTPTTNSLCYRMAEHMELLGADYCEHAVYHPGCGVTRAVSVLQRVPQFSDKAAASLEHTQTFHGNKYV